MKLKIDVFLVSSYIGVSKTFWSIIHQLVQFDPIWSILVGFDTFWSILVHFDPVWSTLIHFDPFWSNFDPIWSNFEYFRVSSTNRNMDSMPGTPATLSSYYDPASPNPSVSSINERPCARGSKSSRSNSLTGHGAARMDLELPGSGGSSNNSDDIDGGSAVAKIVPNLWVVTFLFWSGGRVNINLYWPYRQTKNLFIYCGSHKHFVQDKKMVCIK